MKLIFSELLDSKYHFIIIKSKYRVNYGRKDVIMMILAMEAGFEIPEVLFEVAEALKTDGSLEMRERFAISSEEEEAAQEEISFTSPEEGHRFGFLVFINLDKSYMKDTEQDKSKSFRVVGLHDSLRQLAWSNLSISE